MNESAEERLKKLVQGLTIDKEVMAEEILKHVNALKLLLEFHENVIVIKNQEKLPRRAVLILYMIGKLLLYVAGRLDSPDLSMDEADVIVGGGSESPELVLQEFLNSGWILATSPTSFRVNFRKVGEILREFSFIDD